MEQIVAFFQSYGLVGLIIVAFTESFISPILPDLLLIPLALANPEQAIFYGFITTVASVTGGGIGYWLGKKYGVKFVKKIVPANYIEKIRYWIDHYGMLAIIVAALAPIPYKFVSITAGMFRINKWVFFTASVIGRGKRFLIEGILIYYYGPQALDLMSQYSDDALLLLFGIIIATWGAIKIFKYAYKKTSSI